jgi:sugar lactone lactonase YvrE
MPSRDEPILLATGLSWPESPRWRNGALWLSDVHNFRLARVDMDGSVETVCAVEGRPSGMDFSAEGHLLMATALGRQLLDISVPDGVQRPMADLGSLTKAYLNDLVTSADGWSWVGDTGFVFGVAEPRRCGSLIGWHPLHGARIVAADIFFPNGMAITPDGSTLYLAETFGKCISAFDIGRDGSLDNRRLHAELPGSPDGLCLDAEGCLWVALLFEGRFVRLSPQGKEIDRIDFPGKSAIACIIGDDDKSTLFLCVSRIDKSDPANIVRHGEIHRMRAPAAAAGRP